MFSVLHHHIPCPIVCFRIDTGTYAKTNRTRRKTLGRFTSHDQGSDEKASFEGSNEETNTKADDIETIVEANDGKANDGKTNCNT